MFNKKGFTLIELLIVIGILAVLATTVLLVINPAQMVKQSRDANRITEINQINKAMLLFQSFGGSSTNMGTHGTVYVSIPSDQADCSDLSLPALGGGYVYACKPSTTYRNIDGTGWIPVDLTTIQAQAGNLFSSLPIDPINTVANDYYYTYIPGSWALSATMESEKYLTTTAINDGGESDTRFEMGNNLVMNENLSTGGGTGWSCGNTLIDSRDSKEYNTVLIGAQCWFAATLDYDNGCTSITWVDDTDVGWCGYHPGGLYPNEGLLYQWSAAMNGSTTAGAQGLCPTGWHIPTHDEFTTLERSVCTSGTCATDFPYDTSTTGWRGTEGGAEGAKLAGNFGSWTNGVLRNNSNFGSSGFDGFSASYRNATLGGYPTLGKYTFIWSSSESITDVWARQLEYNHLTVDRNLKKKANGFSVRCLKD